MHKIKVNGNITQSKLAVAVFAIAFICFLSVSIYIIFNSSDLDEKIDAGIAILGILALFLPFYLSYTKEEQVSDLFANQSSLTLLYRYKNKVRQREISKEDIKKFKATYSNFKVSVEIALNSGESIYFDSTSNSPLSTCPYQLILDLIKIKKDLPNFSYVVVDKNPLPMQDIRHFEQLGKRLPMLNRYKLAFSKVPIGLTIFLLSTIAVLIYFSISLIINYPD